VQHEFPSVLLFVYSFEMNPFTSDQAMGNLANTYCDLGRHQDALALKVKSLEFRQRVLHEGHPHTGAT
jgi:hypothetical protein